MNSGRVAVDLRVCGEADAAAQRQGSADSGGIGHLLHGMASGVTAQGRATRAPGAFMQAMRAMFQAVVPILRMQGGKPRTAGFDARLSGMRAGIRLADGVNMLGGRGHGAEAGREGRQSDHGESVNESTGEMHWPTYPKLPRILECHKPSCFAS